jgi:hypothetical protein
MLGTEQRHWDDGIVPAHPDLEGAEVECLIRLEVWVDLVIG